MRLILRENVPNLGKIGDVVDVANGYGRNYLLPRKLALLANDRNVKQLEHFRRVTAVRLERARVAALSVAERLGGLKLNVVKHAGLGGKLYGSVTNREIADLLGDNGFEVDRRDIKISDSIRSVGDYTVKVELHADVVVDVAVHVDASEISQLEAKAEEEAANAEVAVDIAPLEDVEMDLDPELLDKL